MWRNCVSTGFSYEEFLRTPIRLFLAEPEEKEDKFIWYMSYIKLDGGGEYWGEHQLGLERYNSLNSFQKLVFDLMDYKFQIVAKNGSEEDWDNFVKESLTWSKEP
jgi:hypothetical protein